MIVAINPSIRARGLNAYLRQHLTLRQDCRFDPSQHTPDLADGQIVISHSPAPSGRSESVLPVLA